MKRNYPFLTSLLLISTLFAFESRADFAGKEGQYIDEKNHYVLDVDKIHYQRSSLVLEVSSGGEKLSPITLTLKSERSVLAVKKLLATSPLGFIGCSAAPGETCAINDGYLADGFGHQYVKQVRLKDL